MVGLIGFQISGVFSGVSTIPSFGGFGVGILVKTPSELSLKFTTILIDIHIYTGVINFRKRNTGGTYMMKHP